MASSLLLLLFSTLIASSLADEALPCSERNCQLPDCFCSGTTPPKGLAPEAIPQFIMLTFDDSINPNVYKYYDKLFFNRSNPDGCPIRGTFYVTHEWNDYFLAKKLYNEGHEIADHSVTHETTAAFKEADLDRWVKEICGMKKILEIFGQIRKDDVRGFRAPYLQPGGDKMFEAMAKCGVSYDTSMPASEMDPPLWPYTLDFKSTQECKIGPCPKNSHPGLWEVPMTYYKDERGSVCAMVDACHDNGTETSALDMLMKNFVGHYTKNRAPFPMFMHAGWFTVNPYRWNALNQFIDTVLSFPDVYFVTVSDVIEWIRSPKPCENTVDDEGRSTCKLEAMKNWSCKRPGRMQAEKIPEDEVCDDSSRKACVLSRTAHNYTSERRFTTCFKCPSQYPWLGNPDGNLYENMGLSIPESERGFWSPPRGLNLTVPVVETVKPDPALSKEFARKRLFDLLKRKLGQVTANKAILRKVLADQDRIRELKRQNSSFD